MPGGSTPRLPGIRQEICHPWHLTPITLEIQWQRLVNIVDEIDNAVIRTSFSTIVGENHDFGCALMDAEGSGLAQAQWSPPQFCTMLPRTTKAMLQRFPVNTLKEGDVLATNDPWIGSTHLPDYNLISPGIPQRSNCGLPGYCSPCLRCGRPLGGSRGPRHVHGRHAGYA